MTWWAPLSDRREDYLASGVSDDIGGRLARLDGLEVISSATTAGYQDGTNLQEIGRRLGAGYLLVGSVRPEPVPNSSRRVRISVELIQVTQVAAPVTRWQRVYDTIATDLSLVQSSIAKEVAAALSPP